MIAHIGVHGDIAAYIGICKDTEDTGYQSI